MKNQKQHTRMDKLAPVHTAPEIKHNARNQVETPDWINGAPNYDKYPKMTPEEILVMYNID